MKFKIHLEAKGEQEIEVEAKSAQGAIDKVNSTPPQIASFVAREIHQVRSKNSWDVIACCEACGRAILRDVYKEADYLMSEEGGYCHRKCPK